MALACVFYLAFSVKDFLLPKGRPTLLTLTWWVFLKIFHNSLKMKIENKGREREGNVFWAPWAPSGFKQ
jgi:hypothetical protein